MMLTYSAVVLAAVLWAAAASYAASMFKQGASVLAVTQARSWIALLVLAAFELVASFTAANRADSSLGLPKATDSKLAWKIFALGTSLALVNLSYYESFARLPVAIAIVIQYTAPALIVGWFIVRTKRAPSIPVSLGLLGATIGVAMLALGGTVAATQQLDPVGLMLAGFAALTFATYTILSSSMSETIGPRRTLLCGFAVSSLIWLAMQLPEGIPETLLDTRFTLGVLILGSLGTVVPFYLFVWSMKRLGAPRAGIVSMVEPVAAAVIAWVALNQKLGAFQIVGGSIVIASIALVQAERRSNKAPVHV